MRKLVVVVLGILFCLSSTQMVMGAEKFPTKPISCIVGVEAGADGDVITRPITQRISQILGQPVVVVNKPGAGSSLAYREIHSSKPDGYTIGWGSATIITNKLQGVSPLDYHDFTQLGVMATWFPIVVVSTKGKYQFKTIQELIAYAKAHPGELSMSTSGIGQSWWVAAMSFIGGTGLKFNVIPQAGAGALVGLAVAGGHADVGIPALGAVKGMIDGGQVRILATLSEKRAGAPYDNIPTVKELGYEVSWESTNFFMGPPKMRKEVADVFVSAIKQAVEEQEFKKFCADRSARWGYLAPEEVVPAFDKRRVVVREIMNKAGILKEAK